MQLGEIIRQLRAAAGLSQSEFAQRLEITASYLSLVERAKREPTIPLLRKMATVLGAPAALLIAAALVEQEGPEHVDEREAVRHLFEAARMLILAGQMDRRLVHAGVNNHT